MEIKTISWTTNHDEEKQRELSALLEKAKKSRDGSNVFLIHSVCWTKQKRWEV